MAPENAPFLCPKSSLSSSWAGIAAQFMPTKFFALRADCRCSSRLTTSLPAPVSPCIKIGASELAHRAINLISLIASALLPMNVFWAVNRFTTSIRIKRRKY